MATIQVDGQAIESVSVQNNDVILNGSSTPLLMSFPHSGENYPDDFNPNPGLPFEVLDFPNDKYVDELYQARSDLKLASVHANFPRAYIDVNRHQHDIDEKMLAEGKTWYGRLQPTGLKTGTTLFWSKTKEIYDIYSRSLSHVELKQRLAKCFVPYHQQMTEQVELMKRHHGCAYILDCHSMTQFDSKLRGGAQRPQVDIGDRRGQSCSSEFTECVADAYSAQGYDVTINARFVGGEVILRYGWPEINQHILQVELRRDLYMNEESRERNSNFQKVQNDCGEVLKQIKAFTESKMND